MLLAAAPAAAQNASGAGTIQFYPNYHAIGVRLPYTGDANGNATARLEWRPAGGTLWQQGVQMTRITNARWAGSVLWLQPDLAYEIRAVITDPDGGVTASASTRTRKEPVYAPSGRTIWIATNGNDGGTGDTGSPLATIQTAADRAQPGDEIRVRAGTYYQWIDTPRSGTATAPIHLVADGPGVILDGSDPAFLNRTDWRSDGGGIYSVAYTGATRLVAADSTQRLYRQANLSSLQVNANNITQGWTIENGRLYVKMEGGASPNGRPIHVARYNVGVVVDVSYWQVRGLEIRYFGTGSNGAGISLMAGSNRWVWGNNIYTNGGKGIFVRSGASDDLIERNLLRDYRIYTWPWDGTKGHEEEIQGISQRGNRGVVVRYNTINGTFDGIDVAGDPADETYGADCDVHENTISNTRDDALEPETISGINVRIWKNRISNVYSGISIAPNYQGPCYVLYNTFLNFEVRGYKCSISSTGNTYVYHNTFASSRPNTSSIWPSGPYSNVHFMNNILVGNNAGCVSDDAGESQTGNTFDGDLIYSNYPALFRWKGTNYSSITALRTGTGFEMNGRSGDPKFVSLSGNNVALQLGSPAIDGAVRIPGINDLFVGVAPDMGALEYGSGQILPDVTPPAAVTDLN
jgi:hypothetical protein